MLHRDEAPGVHRVHDAGVNWFLVEADEGRALTIVDAGVLRSWGSAQSALKALGRTPRDVAGIVLTHAHFDHVGFAERARTTWGVDVWVPPAEEHLARHPLDYDREGSRVLIPLKHPKSLAVLGPLALAGAFFVPGVEQVRHYDAGPLPAELPGGMVAVDTPGHTHGHRALHLPGRDAVIAGDALVTVDPYSARKGPRIVSRAATADVAQAKRSLDALAATGARTVLVGHGPTWTEGVEEAAALARAADVA